LDDTSARGAEVIEVSDAIFAKRSLAHSVLSSLEGSLYLLDGHLRVLDFGDGWLKMPPEHGWLRFTEPPQIGRLLLDYAYDPAKRAELERAFAVVLAEGQPQELQAVDALGRHWLMHVLPWRQDGQIRGVIYKVTDNTAFVGVQNQLFQAQKLGTIGALAAGVAHDFNNLLLAIRGNVGLLSLDPKTTAETRIRLEQIDSAAGRAADLSQQLLSFSRPSEEKIAVLDFNDVVREVVVLTKRLVRGKITVELHLTPEPPKVQMDPTRASQVLLNLCINAQDAMPEGGKLTITNGLSGLNETQAAKVRRKTGEKFVRCSVSDTGTGIPPDLLSRIFNPFFTTKDKGKGTGLGLSIVHNVVSKAGGFIEVESIVGAGTTFHIYLPVDRGAITKPDTEMRHKLRPGTGRLLVVDDLDLVLDFATNFLKQAGYEVLRASNADAALKLLAEQHVPVDFIFTDYAMPGKTGWQLIQEATSRWPTVPCLLASGYLDDSERAQIAQNPLVRILNKPYGIAEATNVIAEMLQGGKTPSPMGKPPSG
jgi:two-component system cell cycle sensor histidine kinase/response regulator CckA